MAAINPPGSKGKAATFNGPVEVGLRGLCVLTASHNFRHSLQRLTIYDYLVVHSDDVEGGPISLHPATPFRSGELLARRAPLQAGLALYANHGLIELHYLSQGVFYTAGELASGFLDSLGTSYVSDLRERADWLAATYERLSDAELSAVADTGLGKWGAEFTMQSVLRAEMKG